MLELEVPQAIRWQYGGGLAVAVVCVTITGIVHENLDPNGTTMLGQKGRAALRLSVAVIFALLPLIKHINDLAFLGTYVGVFSAMVVIEIWAKLGREERDPTDHTVVEDVEAEREEAEEEAQERARRGEAIEEGSENSDKRSA